MITITEMDTTITTVRRQKARKQPLAGRGWC
jgi:hypothetical protein